MATPVYLLIALIAVCAILVALALLGGRARSIFLPLAVVAALVAAVALNLSQPRSQEASTAREVRESLYVAGRLIEADRPVDALAELSGQDEAGEHATDVACLRALALSLDGATSLAATTLERTDTGTGDAAAELFEASSLGVTASAELGGRLLEGVSESVGPTDDERARWDADYAADWGQDSEAAAATPAADYRLAARRKVIAGDERGAFDEVLAAAHAGDPLADVIASEMYVLGYDGRSFTVDDEEYDALIASVTESEVAVERARRTAAAAEGGDANTREDAAFALDLATAKLRRAEDAFDDAAVMRAANYLKAAPEVTGDLESYRDFQLAYLAYLTRDFREAHLLLDAAFEGATDADDAFAHAAGDLFDAVASGHDASTGTDFSAAMSQMVALVYGNALALTPDEGFSAFVSDHIADENAALSIVDADVSAWPEVTLRVHVDSSKTSVSRLSVTDSGEIVTATETTRVTDTAAISCCYVLDVSSSMRGPGLEDVADAVRVSAGSIAEGDQVALVSFSDTAHVECGLTNSPFLVSAGLSRLRAQGATDIPSGIDAAVDVLEEASGTPVIILLSDGADMNATAAADAVARAIDIGAQIHTVGLEGADEDYLRGIADETGGTFTFVDDTEALTDALTSVRNAIASAYLITYTAPDSDAPARYAEVRDPSSMARSRISYAEAAGGDEGVEGSLQQAGYFRETGGTREDRT